MAPLHTFGLLGRVLSNPTAHVLLPCDAPVQAKLVGDDDRLTVFALRGGGIQRCNTRLDTNR